MCNNIAVFCSSCVIPFATKYKLSKRLHNFYQAARVLESSQGVKGERLATSSKGTKVAVCEACGVTEPLVVVTLSAIFSTKFSNFRKNHFKDTVTERILFANVITSIKGNETRRLIKLDRNSTLLQKVRAVNTYKNKTTTTSTKKKNRKAWPRYPLRLAGSLNITSSINTLQAVECSVPKSDNLLENMFPTRSDWKVVYSGAQFPQC